MVYPRASVTKADDVSLYLQAPKENKSAKVLIFPPFKDDNVLWCEECLRGGPENSPCLLGKCPVCCHRLEDRLG